jgi:Putative Ig domain
MRHYAIDSRCFIPILVCASILATQLARAQEGIHLPDAQAGIEYSAEIRAEGGLPPLTWNTAGGEIPPGLHVTDDGRIEGTPRVARREPYTFELKVTDSSRPPQSAVRSFNVTKVTIVAAPLRITGIVQKNHLRILGVRAEELVAAGLADPSESGAESLGKRNPQNDQQTAGNAATQSPGNQAPNQQQAAGPQATPPQAAGSPKDNTNCKTQGQFSIDPAEARIAPGGTVHFTATVPASCTLPTLTWDTAADWKSEDLWGKSIDFKGNGTFADLSLKGSAADITNKITNDRSKAYIHITATADAKDGGQIAEALVVITTEPGGNIVIPVIGFEQAGASAAQSAQKFFFNFFISRPLPFGDTGGSPFGTRYHWFGSVRIASYPQQINSGVGEFATGFAGQVAQLKVNQIAQAGEFTTGLDVRFKDLPKGLYPVGSSSGSEHALLSFVAGFGAVSPLNPVESLQIFLTPPAGSAQRAPFLQQFPSSANFTYTGFVTPDRGRFFWEYGAGLRLTNLFFDKSGIQSGAPAMLTYSLGQNQMVSGGVSSGVVQRIEGFLPLLLGERFAKNVTTLYLFGRADMRLASPHQITPFILQPAPSGVNGFDPNVNIIAVRSNRDLYTIGVGVDAVKLIKTIALQNKVSSKSSTSGATAPPAQ